MAAFSYIVDALRRIGSQSEKSALRRQDRQLEGHTVLERSRATAIFGDETAIGFNAVIEPTPEEVSILQGEAHSGIVKNASLADGFFDAFGIDSDADLLDRLDWGFEEWTLATDRLGYSGQAVVEILGACFGEHCIDSLGMRWIVVIDDYGTSLAIDGIDSEFRGYPYVSIQKRIETGEHSFFRGIYIFLANQKEVSRRRVQDS